MLENNQGSSLLSLSNCRRPARTAFSCLGVKKNVGSNYKQKQGTKTEDESSLEMVFSSVNFNPRKIYET